MKVIKNIIQGWWYYLLYLLEQLPEKHYQMYLKRQKVCNTCSFNRLGVCAVCGCVTKAKCMCKECECPIMLWV